ncbi:cyclopropane-fatty-acyl-phospholipid synthase [Piscirickettsia litoralis]|uniref:Cyclopropane-fatty-acyl-phospholipid synthase n=1 Tax=Piscirickettsia litoralis TaxID=1891921 RepID=A0ABX3A8Y5_9GAMM|nr:cyclopropane-fatty-acyl-phospholipid synthase [Piscirickettsia litoralis]
MQVLLDYADIQINGSRPWDIQVHDPRAYKMALKSGSLGLGEAYMAGLWDCQQLDTMITKMLEAKLEGKLKTNLGLLVRLFTHKIFNFQTQSRAFEVGEKHYDIGNSLYQRMLDPTMSYTCAYWQHAKTLEQAQLAKLELICQKLELEPGMKLLDIGCGWGGMAKYAAENYGVKVVGVTISKEQQHYAQDYCKGLPVEIRLQDYRDLNETFDRIVSIGMFEHVGPKNYQTYMEVAHKSLKEGGLFLLHTIGNNISTVKIDDWVEKYIFPNAVIPSINQIGKAAEELFVMEDWHNFGPDYDKTLCAWHDNFTRTYHEIEQDYSPRFYRMWRYYLMSCAACFRSRDIQLWQLVLSKGRAQKYISHR